jgi:hypothetical protein
MYICCALVGAIKDLMGSTFILVFTITISDIHYTYHSVQFRLLCCSQHSVSWMQYATT